jgi:hypothetical protein
MPVIPCYNRLVVSSSVKVPSLHMEMNKTCIMLFWIIYVIGYFVYMTNYVTNFFMLHSGKKENE